MTISYSEKNIYWNYYISIEEDLNKLSRFIEFAEKNEKVFSIELFRLLISSSSEFEVVSKELCKVRRISKRIKGMKDIRTGLVSSYRNIYDHNIYDVEISIPKFGMKYKPLLNWKDDEDCDWWDSYNLVKHNRNAKYEEAHLKNVINAIGALQIVNRYYYKSLISESGNIAINRGETPSLESCLIKVSLPENVI